MAGTTAKRRPRSHVETDDEAHAARYADESLSSPMLPGSYKKMRLRGGRGAHSQVETEDDNDEDAESIDEFQSFVASDGNVTPPRADGRIAARGESSTPSFAPGAIVRVKVENFVTYERAEFFPGPSLNMVIGPNGTGKSSLLCAICLGLGYPASTLGRATSFGEFVKHGKEHAIVEVELQKRPQDRANYVVKLRINREDNTRNFWLNTKSCTHGQIKKLMQALRIQIDNLCQFLPQDKVAEFAGLNSIELLNKTLQAAATEDVISQQAELKNMFDEQKSLQRGMETESDHLRSLQTRQQGLQADVERLREREQIQQSVTDLNDCRLVAEYNEKKALFEKTREQKKRAQQQLARLRELNGPSLDDLTSKQAYEKQIESVLKARRKRALDAGHEADKALRAAEAVQEEVKELENAKNAEQQSLNRKKQQVSDERTKITKLEAQYKTGKDIESKFNPAEWNHKIRECKARLDHEIKDDMQELEAQMNEIKGKGSQKHAELKSTAREIQNLDSQEGQRLLELRRLSPEIAKAYDWLQENKSEFEKEVFGPPMLSCSVKDKRYFDQVQVALQNDDFLCFTAQTRNDHKKLTDHLFKKLSAAVAVRTIMTDLNAFRSPLSQDDLTSMGLDGYALDFLEGPAPVLAMLCSEKKIHLTGVALKELSDEQFQRISSDEKINSFAAGKTYYRITRRREYGPGATSTVSKTIQRGKFWSDEPVDAAAKAELEQRRADLQEEVNGLLREVKSVQEKINELKAQSTEVQEEMKRLEQEKSQLQRELNEWRNLPVKIDVQKKSLQRARDDLDETKQRLSSFDDEFDKLALKRAKLSVQHSEHVSLLRDTSQAVLEAQIRHIEAISDVAALKERNQTIVQRLRDEEVKVEELARQHDEVKAQARAAQSAIRELLAGPDGEIDAERRDFLVDLAGDKSVETITEDIEAENAKLELIHAADPGVLRDFERRAQEIARLEAGSASKREELEQLNDKIRELREAWEPELDDIIRRINDAFSYNFEQINCAGEVDVHKDEDFDKWAIEIKVKFRENETLQKLDQHRQSGGERAVSTIFYLMSLQSMAQSPFRVVDEINQGMDPRNERMVHERMVEIACREHTSQYFLITPKLLPNLRYDERMRILCIASGEHMPAEGGRLDFAKCVKIKRRLMADSRA